MPGGSLCPANHITITNEKRIDIHPAARLGEPSTGCRNRQKSTVSGNVARKLKSLCGKIATLCPETDGLQPKYRIVYIPEGTTYIEQKKDLVNYAYEKFSSLLKDKRMVSQLDAQRISRILHVVGFPQEEVFQILRKERYQRK